MFKSRTGNRSALSLFAEEAGENIFDIREGEDEAFDIQTASQ